VYAYRQCYAEVGIDGHTVFDGIADTLQYLKAAGARMFVATSKPVTFASQIIQQHGLSGVFQTVYGSELDGTRADKTELIAYVLASERLSPDTCIMIGDRKHDIIGAIKNSVGSAGVLWGYGSRDELVEAGAERVVERPSCLRTMIS
jgi:phosphoglycolate phosphatase